MAGLDLNYSSTTALRHCGSSRLSKLDFINYMTAGLLEQEINVAYSWPGIYSEV